MSSLTLKFFFQLIYAIYQSLAYFLLDTSIFFFCGIYYFFQLIYSDYAKEIYFDHKKKSHLNHLIKPTEPNLTKLDCGGGAGGCHHYKIVYDNPPRRIDRNERSDWSNFLLDDACPFLTGF
jgi:hypothetical protein